MRWLSPPQRAEHVRGPAALRLLPDEALRLSCSADSSFKTPVSAQDEHRCGRLRVKSCRGECF